MKGSEVFPSRWLKADDLDGDVEVIIEDVTMEKLKDPQTGKDEQKAVVWFKGEDKGMVINVTNWRTAAETFGSDDSDDWRGKPITLGARQVEAFGKLSFALRFIPKPKRAASARPIGRPVNPPIRPAAQSEQEAADSAADNADQVPF